MATVRYHYKGGKVVDRVLINCDGKIAVIAKSAELGSASITGNEWDELINGKTAD